jgi:hypothetical protein
MKLQPLLDRMRAFNAQQVELAERALLLQQPWEEDYLHWAHDGESWRLHGHVLPPPHGRHSTTSTGWCAGRLH